MTKKTKTIEPGKYLCKKHFYPYFEKGRVYQCEPSKKLKKFVQVEKPVFRTSGGKLKRVTRKVDIRIEHFVTNMEKIKK